MRDAELALRLVREIHKARSTARELWIESPGDRGALEKIRQDLFVAVKRAADIVMIRAGETSD